MCDNDDDGDGDGDDDNNDNNNNNVEVNLGCLERRFASHARARPPAVSVRGYTVTYTRQVRCCVTSRNQVKVEPVSFSYASNPVVVIIFVLIST